LGNIASTPGGLKTAHLDDKKRGKWVAILGWNRECYSTPQISVWHPEFSVGQNFVTAWEKMINHHHRHHQHHHHPYDACYVLLIVVGGYTNKT